MEFKGKFAAAVGKASVTLGNAGVLTIAAIEFGGSLFSLWEGWERFGPEITSVVLNATERALQATEQGFDWIVWLICEGGSLVGAVNTDLLC